MLEFEWANGLSDLNLTNVSQHQYTFGPLD